MKNAVCRVGRLKLKAIAGGLCFAFVILCLPGCGGSSGAFSSGNSRHSFSSITISPSNPTVGLGDTERFVAIGIFSDGRQQDVTTTVTWSSADAEIAPIDQLGRALAKKSGVTTITAASGSVKTSVTLTVPSPTLSSIRIVAPALSIPKGASEQLNAIGSYIDGSTKDITGSVTWNSSAPAIVTANAAGSIAGVSAGAATVTASSGVIRGVEQITVEQSALVSLAIVPPNSSLAKGATQQLSVSGTFSDGSVQDVTSNVTWMMSPATVATISSSGLVTTLSTGSATITAISGSRSTAAQLTVTAAALTSLSIAPANPTMAKGSSRQLTVTGTFADGSTQNLTSNVAWTVSGAAITVSSLGVLNAVANGTAVVTATSGSLSASDTITVSAATLSSLSIAPQNPSVSKGGTRQLTVTGTFSDGTTQDLTGSVTWVSASPNVTVGSSGMVTGVANGTASVTATSGSISASDTVTVLGSSLVSLAISPPNPSIPPGKTKQLTVTGTFNDGSTQDLTGAVAWAVAPANVVSVSGTGLVSAIANGSATVMATSGPVSTSASVTVSASSLVSIAITPPNPSVAKGATQQLTATGTYSDGSTQDVTAKVLWSSSPAALADLSSNGLLKAKDLGTANVVASSGSTSGTTTVTISAAVPVSLSISPANSFIMLGSSQQLKAIEVLSDGTTQNVPGAVMWNSSNPTVAQVATNGVVRARAIGTATISVSSDSLSGSTTVNVEPMKVVERFDNANVPGTDATISVSNPGFGGEKLCAMVYVFAADQQLSECCGCRITKNGLRRLSINDDLTSNPLTGKMLKDGTVQIVPADATASTCDPTSFTPAGSLSAWATHVDTVAPGTFTTTDTHSQSAPLSSTDLPYLQSQCQFINALGSGQGTCTCGTGD